jgi:hypothetical protein
VSGSTLIRELSSPQPISAAFAPCFQYRWLKEGELIGIISIYRQEVLEFTRSGLRSNIGRVSSSGLSTVASSAGASSSATGAPAKQ